MVGLTHEAEGFLWLNKVRSSDQIGVLYQLHCMGFTCCIGSTQTEALVA